MPRLPADIRISLKTRGAPTHRIEVLRHDGLAGLGDGLALAQAVTGFAQAAGEGSADEGERAVSEALRPLGDEAICDEGADAEPDESFADEVIESGAGDGDGDA